MFSSVKGQAVNIPGFVGRMIALCCGKTERHRACFLFRTWFGQLSESVCSDLQFLSIPNKSFLFSIVVQLLPSDNLD